MRVPVAVFLATVLAPLSAVTEPTPLLELQSATSQQAANKAQDKVRDVLAHPATWITGLTTAFLAGHATMWRSGAQTPSAGLPQHDGPFRPEEVFSQRVCQVQLWDNLLIDWRNVDEHLPAMLSRDRYVYRANKIRHAEYFRICNNPDVVRAFKLCTNELVSAWRQKALRKLYFYLLYKNFFPKLPEEDCSCSIKLLFFACFSSRLFFFSDKYFIFFSLL